MAAATEFLVPPRAFHNQRPAIDFLAVHNMVQDCGERIISENADDDWLPCLAKCRLGPINELREVINEARFDQVLGRIG